LAKSGRIRVYNVPVLSKALDILELLEAEKHPVSLESVYQRTRFSKTTVYRILKTFVHRGYIAHHEDGLYRLISRPRKTRFGYAGQSEKLAFSQAVTTSVKEAASSSGVDLLVLDNRYDGEVAVRNAETFVKEQVDLVIEFQIDQRVAPIISDKIAAAGIPLIAVEIHHPHATFLGVDNYRVGFEAGEFLGQHASTTWKGVVNWVVGLDIEEAGPLVQSRITGAFEGVRSVLPELPIGCFVRMDGRGMDDESFRLIFEFLRRHHEGGILIAAGDDTSALGALRAVKDLKREKHVVIVGQDCIPEAIEEMKVSGSSLIGSVSREAHTYGARLIELGIALVQGKRVPPYNYVEHKLVTADALLNRKR
jgi:ribose transport system substrate-binding protein